jgi:glycosyltransferase involved in cell wall biosynthesis
MRVLLISLRYQSGGAERCARELFERLPGRGVETAMWVATPPDAPVPHVRSIRLPGERWLFPLNFLPTIADWRFFGSRRRLGRLSAGDFDVVHLHNIHGNWLSIQAVQELCRRVPVVWTLHDEWAATGGMPYDLTRHLSLEDARRYAAGSPPYQPFYPGAWSRRWARFLDQYLPQPTVAVCPSQYLLDLVRRSGHFPQTALEHVPNGVALLEEPAATMDQNEARRALGLPKAVSDPAAPLGAEGADVILLVAADLRAPYKGVALGVEALKKLGAARSRARLPHILVLGRGAESIVRELAGALPATAAYAADAATLAQAYRAADVLLVPSLADNFPYTIIEAFACTRPFAGFGIGGLPELAGANEPEAQRRGVLARPYDVTALAQLLSQLLADRAEREALGQRARQWVQQQCSMPGFLTRMIGVYDQAISTFRAGLP